MSTDRLISVSTAFAEALDQEDYAAAEALLTPDCSYSFRSDVFTGPAAIIATYRRNGDTANVVFDGIEYESAVSAIGPDTAAIDFVDRLRHRGAEHVHRCRQVLTVDPSGRIREIAHVDLPGESASFEAFLAKEGLTRDADGRLQRRDA